MATQLNYENARLQFLAHRLRMARLALGYSQEYVALSLGMIQPTISSYENGNTAPDYDRLIQMAIFYGVSILYFFPDMPD